MDSSSGSTHRSSKPIVLSSSLGKPGAKGVSSACYAPQGCSLGGQSSAKEGVQGHQEVVDKLKAALLALGESGGDAI